MATSTVLTPKQSRKGENLSSEDSHSAKDDFNRRISVRLLQLLEMRGWRASHLISAMGAAGIEGPSSGHLSELLSLAKATPPKRRRRWNAEHIEAVAQALGVDPSVLTLPDNAGASRAWGKWTTRVAEIVEKHGLVKGLGEIALLIPEYVRDVENHGE